VKKAIISMIVIALFALAAQSMMAQDADMTFFLTGKGPDDQIASIGCSIKWRDDA